MDSTLPIELVRLTNTKIGFLLEDPPLYQDMTVQEYLKFVGSLKKVSAKKLVKNFLKLLPKNRICRETPFDKKSIKSNTTYQYE